jgi:hypothetical protein
MILPQHGSSGVAKPWLRYFLLLAFKLTIKNTQRSTKSLASISYINYIYEQTINQRISNSSSIYIIEGPVLG